VLSFRPAAWRRPKNLYPKRQDLSATRGSGLCPGEGSARGEGDSSVAPNWLRSFPGSPGWALSQNDRCFLGFGICPIRPNCHSEGGAAWCSPFAQRCGADRRIFIRSGRIFPSRGVPGLCPGEDSARGEGDSSVAPTGSAVFPEVRGGRFLRMTGVSSDLEYTRSDQTVILREVPRGALLSPNSVAPTEESLSEAAGSFRHAGFPGSARERAPREGREILRSRQRAPQFSRKSGVGALSE
jgi:hypothetical protein